MGLYKDLKQSVQKKIIKKIIYGLSDSSDENILKLANTLEKIIPNKDSKNILESVKELIRNNHPAVSFIKRIMKEIDPNCRDKFMENLVIQGLILNDVKRKKVQEEGSFTPTSVLISPTMRCNLSCTGCYAGNYSKKDDLGFELFDRIVSEAEDMGAAIFTILGGEPFVVKDELFKICRKHNKSYFQVYTNGTLIDEETAKELRDLGNLLLTLSIEGYKKETDERRGEGVYDKVINVMDLLRKYRIPFGYSVSVTSKNAELVSSDEFIDFMINKGAYIGWHFLYMPIGSKPDLSLMPTPWQRKMLRDRWIKIRNTKPIFIVDFWNDAPIVGGCIAGKHYIHINSKGDAEPCIFTHFAVDNIKNKSLKEIMASDYFKELRKKQPFNDNLYMPCMWIDNPEVGREMHIKFGCYPTHGGADVILKDEKIKKGLDKYSKEVKKLFDPVWKEEQAIKAVKKSRGPIC